MELTAEHSPERLCFSPAPETRGSGLFGCSRSPCLRRHGAQGQVPWDFGVLFCICELQGSATIHGVWDAESCQAAVSFESGCYFRGLAGKERGKVGVGLG